VSTPVANGETPDPTRRENILYERMFVDRTFAQRAFDDRTFESEGSADDQ
jgi:hypothetical protein